MFCYRKPRPTCKFAHRTFPRTSLLCRHCTYHIDHFPPGQLLYLERGQHSSNGFRNIKPRYLTVDFNFFPYKVRVETYKSLPPSAVESITEEHSLTCSRFMLTSSSGTPNLRRSCLAFLRESRRRSASVPVTVFFTGWGSLSSCSEEAAAYQCHHLIVFPSLIFGYFPLLMPHIYSISHT